MKKNVLDFMIIGAQKAGTTSLFKYLQSHPDIYMLPEKEGAFFSYDERFSLGWNWYVREFFGDAPPEKLWGKASPDYMADPRVPLRIRDVMPAVKLIAVLRHPIHRAFSHYRMSLRKDIEPRTFETVIEELLQPDKLEEARERPSPTNSYIVRGEYGRILAEFYRLFPEKHIAVFWAEDLKSNPAQVVQSIFQFLEVEAGFVPQNLGVIYHQGGVKLRLPWMRTLKSQKLLWNIWQAVPGKHRRRLAYWFHQWNVVSDAQDSPAPRESVQQLLISHYAEDLGRLSSLIDKPIPWHISTPRQDHRSMGQSSRY